MSLLAFIAPCCYLGSKVNNYERRGRLSSFTVRRQSGIHVRPGARSSAWCGGRVLVGGCGLLWCVVCVRASASRSIVKVYGHSRPSGASAHRGQPREIMMIVGSMTQFSYQTK